jgi:hypothetical protein
MPAKDNEEPVFDTHAGNKVLALGSDFIEPVTPRFDQL